MPKPSIIKPAIRTDHVFAAVYGDTGVGKSRLAGTSARLGKTLMIRPPQEHWDSLDQADLAKIEQAIVNDYDDLLELQEHLRSEDGANWEWVWLDNIQGIFDVMLDDLWDTVLREKPARARYGLDKPEYGIVMERLQRWVRHVVGPDTFNFGYTAHAETTASPDLDEDGDPIVKMVPWIQGKGMPTKIAGYTNVVGYYEKAKFKGSDEEKRVLRTESTPRYYAKDQFHAFGGKPIEPTIPKMMELIEKQRGKNKPAGTTSRPSTGRRRVVRR